MSKLNRARKLLERGLQFHQAGQLAEAEQLYLEAAALDPRNPDTCNLRGLVALATGRPRDAATLLRKATVLQPDNPGFWGNLGNALFETGAAAEAEAAFRRASRLDPNNPNFGIGIANALSDMGQIAEAGAILQAIVARYPGQSMAWFSLGRLAETSAQTEQALECYQRALQANPQYGDAHLNIGVLLQGRQRLEEAEQCYRRALFNSTHRETALTNLISVLSQQGKFGEAAQLAKNGTADYPDLAELYWLWSAACVQQGHMNKALPPAQQAATLAPENARFQLGVGALLFECGFPAQGLAILAQVGRTHADNPDIAYAIGVTQLMAGQFHEGWKGFVQRELRRAKILSRPWLSDRLPSSLDGTTLRLWREQGLGDELFFLRFASALKRLGATVAYQTNPKLVSMLQRNGDIDDVSEEPAQGSVAMPPADGSVDLLVGDLPHALYRRLAPEQCALPAGAAVQPSRAPACPRIFYPEVPPPLALSALPERVAAVREQLQRLGPPPYLALTWRGGIAPHEQKGQWWTLYKNISLEAFGHALCGLPHTLLAVQRKPLPGEIDALARAAGAAIHDLCEVNEDLEQMLALMAVVDDYAGVSNTNMHLRAGLGLPARVLVPRPSEWRWMAYGDTSPWFPGFRVYRQELDGGWQSALQRLHADLSAARGNA